MPEAKESVLNQNCDDPGDAPLQQPMNIKTLLKRKQVMVSAPFIGGGNWIVPGSSAAPLLLRANYH